MEGGALFVALIGENFDAHNFLDQALGKGAAGLLVQKGAAWEAETGSIPVMEVEDTLFALGELAHYHLERAGVPVLAVTGSTGKTTTKEMLAEVMAAHFDGQVLKTEGNFNNLIGLPLTVFGLDSSHKAAVLEMGMSLRGEIRRLARIARPMIGVITNVSAVHLEHLKTIGAVAEAKSELLEDFGADHFAVLNADDARVSTFGKGKAFKTLTFGIEHPVDVYAGDIIPKGFEGIDFTLHVGNETAQVLLSCIGKHNVYNALASAAAAHAFGVPMETIVRGLAAFRPAAMRSRILDIFGIKVLDDTYNANPSSMDAALEMLVELTKDGRTIAVLGDMFELGDETAAAHRRLGRHAAKLGLSRLYLLGENAPLVAEGAREEKLPEENIKVRNSHKEIVLELRQEGQRGDVILVKGSRGMRMERIVKGLKGEPV
jgi:UDP-N-acetylmuramoyl-tripeptide--D-alanyl-D-alanine ligase